LSELIFCVTGSLFFLGKSFTGTLAGFGGTTIDFTCEMFSFTFRLVLATFLLSAGAMGATSTDCFFGGSLGLGGSFFSIGVNKLVLVSFNVSFGMFVLLATFCAISDFSVAGVFVAAMTGTEFIIPSFFGSSVSEGSVSV